MKPNQTAHVPIFYLISACFWLLISSAHCIILGVQPVGLINWTKPQVERMAITLAAYTGAETEIAFAYRLQGDISLGGDWKLLTEPIDTAATKFFASNKTSTVLSVAIYLRYFNDETPRSGKDSPFWQGMKTGKRNAAAKKERGNFNKDVSAIVNWAWAAEALHRGKLKLILIPILEDKVTNNATFNLVEMAVEAQVAATLTKLAKSEPSISRKQRVERFLTKVGLRRSTIGTAKRDSDVVVRDNLLGSMRTHLFSITIETPTGTSKVSKNKKWDLETHTRITDKPTDSVFDDVVDAKQSDRGAFCNDGGLVWAKDIDGDDATGPGFYSDKLIVDNSAYTRELSNWKSLAASQLNSNDVLLLWRPIYNGKKLTVTGREWSAFNDEDDSEVKVLKKFLGLP